MPLSTGLLELVADTKEVLIETRSGEEATRTVIWVGVSGDMVSVRSVRGESGRWYQRAIANDDVTLIIGEFRLELRAIPANDPASIEAASEGFGRKYPNSGSLDAMLRPEVLGTTLRLESRS